MDPEESPELPPLKRGTYDIEAILAAAENAEFAIPPPPSKTSFNSNPFASSTPSSFRSSFNTSTTPSINNSPYPTTTATTTIDEFDFPAPPSEKPKRASTRKKDSIRSTLSKFSAPKKADLEPAIAETNIATLDYHSGGNSNNNDIFGDTTMTTAATKGNNDLSFEDKQAGMTSPTIVNTVKPRPLRSTPLNRVASPVAGGSHLDAFANSPSRASSPNNVSSNSIGAGNELAVYSTPSSSRPTSRPTSRPHSRVSNGRYHSRQLSSDSLTSFNAMIDNEDMDELSRSGHVSFVVSDPEHKRLLEEEIGDPFSPSMSSNDPDADAYLSNLIQQTSPFGSIKSSSRGQSPAFKSRKQRQAEGDDSFFDSTDDALSDREGSRFRRSRSGSRTPSSPLSRISVRQLAMTSAGLPPSLNQVLDQGIQAGATGPSGTLGSQDQPKTDGGFQESQLPIPKSEEHQLDGKQDPTDAEHVEVDVMVQNVNVNDDSKKSDYSDLDHEDSIPFNQSGTEVLADEEMNFHESHAQSLSFADWMSSSAEISRLDISPPVGAGHFPLPSISEVITSTPLPTMTVMPGPHGTSLLSPNPGNADVLTSSYTPASPSPEAALAPSMPTPPTASERSMLLEKRSKIMENIIAKAKGHSKRDDDASHLSGGEEKKKSIPVSPSGKDATPDESTETGTPSHSVSFSIVDDVKVLEKSPEESDKGEGEGAEGTLTVPSREKRDFGLVRRPSGVMLSSRIRDSTNLDAPRYSIREMEDMKKNVRMDLRIEITNEIREEYERSAEQEAAIYQSEIEELKASLEKEKREKEGLKSVLDEFESSLADFAVSTATEIQTIKEQNIKLTETKEETEEAFILLKTRYDELRDLNSKHVENEGILRKAIENLKQDYETSESRYENLKTHADMKLLHASQELEQAKIVYDNEIAMLKAQLGRQEMQMRTLEQALEIKTKENQDLILFSEELIAKLS